MHIPPRLNADEVEDETDGTLGRWRRPASPRGRFLAMELVGLEPTTSWVRSNTAAPAKSVISLYWSQMPPLV